jgi:hypothetical protein
MKALVLRGYGRLAADGVVGVTRLVEAMHARIARPFARDDERLTRVGGVAGLVYRSVRGGALGVGWSIDRATRLLLGEADDAPAPHALQRLRAATNGVLGDHLAASGNPLALPMRWHLHGRRLDVELRGIDTAVSPHLLVLVHGLCLGPAQWRRRGHEHGEALSRELGSTPLHLEYNSGLHISANGAEFAQLMQRTLERWPVKVRSIAILAHSMGGLVARSALHQAVAQGLDWPGRLRDLIFLGTPHQGAPLEGLGHQVDRQLQRVRYLAPFALIGGVRSAGITDLRRGDLLERDWQAGRARPRTPVPLPARVRCATIAGVLHPPQTRRAQQWIGDGLVPLASALGEHAQPEQALRFAPSRRRVFEDLGHFDLLGDMRVYAQLLEWLRRRPRGERA